MRPVTPKRTVRLGLVGSVGIIYVAMVGMVQTFDGVRLVGEQVTLGRLLLVLPPLSAAYVLARPRVISGEMVRATVPIAAIGGAAVGLIGGAISGLGVVIVDSACSRTCSG